MPIVETALEYFDQLTVALDESGDDHMNPNIRALRKSLASILCEENVSEAERRMLEASILVVLNHEAHVEEIVGFWVKRMTKQDVDIYVDQDVEKLGVRMNEKGQLIISFEVTGDIFALLEPEAMDRNVTEYFEILIKSIFWQRERFLFFIEKTTMEYKRKEGTLTGKVTVAISAPVSTKTQYSVLH